MSNVLIITKSEKSAHGLKALLLQEGFDRFKTAQSAEKAKLCTAIEAFDLIFIYTPLEDEVGAYRFRGGCCSQRRYLY